MTTLVRCRLTCLCGAVFESFRADTHMNVGQDSDLRPHVLEEPLPYFIHTCPSCSGTGYAEDFTKCEDVERLRPGCGPASPPPTHRHKYDDREFEWPIVNLHVTPYRETSLRFALAANECRARGDPQHIIGDRWLKASWAARMCGDLDFMKACQRQARDHLIAGLEAGAQGDVADTSKYLAGELSRRLGDFEVAELFLSQIPANVPSGPPTAKLLEMVRSHDSAGITWDGEPERKAGDRTGAIPLVDLGNGRTTSLTEVLDRMLMSDGDSEKVMQEIMTEHGLTMPPSKKAWWRRLRDRFLG